MIHADARPTISLCNNMQGVDSKSSYCKQAMMMAKGWTVDGGDDGPDGCLGAECDRLDSWSCVVAVYWTSDKEASAVGNDEQSLMHLGRSE